MRLYCITYSETTATRYAAWRYTLIRHIAAGIYLVGIVFYRVNGFVLFQNADVGVSAAMDTGVKRKVIVCKRAGWLAKQNVSCNIILFVFAFCCFCAAVCIDMAGTAG